MSGILTASGEETYNMGRWMANEIIEGVGQRHGAVVLALTGQLGSGKTTFVQGLAEGLGVKEDLQSPTFVLLREYSLPIVVEGQPTTLVHIDAYRLERPEDLNNLGLREIIDDPKRVVVVEWAERIRPAIPPDAIWIEFQHVTNHQRRVIVQAHDKRNKNAAAH